MKRDKNPRRRAPPVRAPEEGGFVPDPDGGSEAPSGGRFARFLSATWSALKLGAGVMLVVGASAAVAWGAHRYALTTPRFAVRGIELRGNVRISEERARELAGLALGQNVFSVDTVAAEHGLLGDAWIKEAKVTRQLPSTISVELTEREAGAVASIGERLYLVTRTGEPFKELADGDPYDLPVVTGVSAENLARDRPREIERISVALDVLRHYERVPLSASQPAQEVNLADDGNVTLTVGKSGVTLALGKGPWRKKLLMAARVLGSLQSKGKAPGIVFLDNEAHPERVVVRMR